MRTPNILPLFVIVSLSCSGNHAKTVTVAPTLPPSRETLSKGAPAPVIPEPESAPVGQVTRDPGANEALCRQVISMFEKCFTLRMPNMDQAVSECTRSVAAGTMRERRIFLCLKQAGGKCDAFKSCVSAGPRHQKATGPVIVQPKP